MSKDLTEIPTPEDLTEIHIPKNLIVIPQFAYGVIKPDTAEWVQGLCTSGISTCMGFVATAAPSPDSKTTTNSMLCHMDAGTSIEETFLEWKKDIPAKYNVTIYLSNTNGDENYTHQIDNLAKLGVEIKIISDLPSHGIRMERDILRPRDMDYVLRDFEIQHPNTGPIDLITHFFEQRDAARDQNYELIKNPILFYDGNKFLTVNEILDQRPDVKEFLDVMDLRQAFEKIKKLDPPALLGGLDSLLELSAKIINKNRRHIYTCEDSDEAKVTNESLQNCLQNNPRLFHVGTSLARDRGIETSMKTAMRELRTRHQDQEHSRVQGEARSRLQGVEPDRTQGDEPDYDNRESPTP